MGLELQRRFAWELFAGFQCTELPPVVILVVSAS